MKLIIIAACLVATLACAAPNVGGTKMHSSSVHTYTVSTPTQTEKPLLRQLVPCSLSASSKDLPSSFAADPKIIAITSEATKLEQGAKSLCKKYDLLHQAREAKDKAKQSASSEVTQMKVVIQQKETICKRLAELEKQRASKEAEYLRIEAQKIK